MSKFEPYRPEEDEDRDRGVVWFGLSLFGPQIILHLFWLTGYAILQYVFVWNRWKVIKYQGWATFITGVLFWVVLVITLIVFN